MKNQNITFQQFIERIKTIDVGELLEKAKSIKVQDIRSLKFSDLKNITKSGYFYPSLGIFFAGLTSILFFFPSLASLKNRQSKAQQYKTESQELQIIDEELIMRNEAKKKFDLIYDEFIGIVPQKAELVLIPEILYEASKRSGAEIIEFAPITQDELNSCRSLSDEDIFENLDGNFDNNFDNNFDAENFDENYDMPPDDMNFGNLASDKLGSKLEVNEFFISENDGINEFESIKENISEIFESNYFLINIKSDYLASLNFLKYLQEYKMAILQYCFEPQMKSNTFNNPEQNNSSPIGQIEARVIINVPIYKEK